MKDDLFPWMIYSFIPLPITNMFHVFFKSFQTPSFKIQPDKCAFICKEVAFLGHLITKNGVKPNHSKIDLINNFPLPKNPKQVKSFHGLFRYYRKFINSAKISKPIKKLFTKSCNFRLRFGIFKIC